MYGIPAYTHIHQLRILGTYCPFSDQWGLRGTTYKLCKSLQVGCYAIYPMCTYKGRSPRARQYTSLGQVHTRDWGLVYSAQLLWYNYITPGSEKSTPLIDTVILT